MPYNPRTKFDVVIQTLADMDAEVHAVASISQGEEAEALEAIRAGIALTLAAAQDIGGAVRWYERAIAPMAEQDRGSDRMFK